MAHIHSVIRVYTYVDVQPRDKAPSTID